MRMTVMNLDSALTRLDAVLAAAPAVDPAELDAIWPALPPVHIDELRGLWRLTVLNGDHVANSRVIDPDRWFGKRFVSEHEVHPMLYLNDEGELYPNRQATGGGDASLWMTEFRGELTAAMVYDTLPIVDHFKRIDERTVLGLMNGKPELVLDNGKFFYFTLEQV